MESYRSYLLGLIYVTAVMLSTFVISLVLCVLAVPLIWTASIGFVSERWELRKLREGGHCSIWAMMS
jgi:hypothetical protein